MCRWKITKFLLVLLLILSFPLQAQENNYYFGFGLGSSQFNLNKPNIIESNASLTQLSSFTDSSTSFSIFGGMPLDEYLSLEADFLFTGDITASDSSKKTKLFDVSTLALTVVYSKQINEDTTLFGKLGVHMWDISESSGDLDTINNAVDITYGLGVDFNLYGTDQRQLRLQWNHYEFDDVFIESNDTITVSLLFLH